MELYDNFSDKSKMILEQAYIEVSNMNMNYVGSEHILLSLLKVKSEIVDQVKRYNRLTYKDVKKECLRFVGIGLVPREIQGYSRRASELLRQASFEANALKSLKVEPEHILLSLLDVTESTAVKVLEKIGFSAFDLKTDVIRELDTKDKQKAKVQKESLEGSFLERYGVDMTQQARENKYDQLVGRGEEVHRIIQIIGRRTKNNPCLVGEPGVGKTAIVEGVAQMMVSGHAPDYLVGKKLVAVSLGAMLAGSKFRGEFEDRLTQLINEVRQKRNIILFIDEIHTLVGAGATQGAMDASNILKPFLSRDDIQLIGATTVVEYRKYIEKDQALERRLQPVRVQEPDVAVCEEMLKGIKPSYETFHNIEIEDAAVHAAVSLSHKYILDRFMPDKAIDLMDEAASRVRLSGQGILTADHVKEVVALWTGIPITDLKDTEHQAILDLEMTLKSEIIGQDFAIGALVNGIIRNRVGLGEDTRPMGSFVFIGQSGVGKTALAKSLAKALFSDERALIRVDMSEYMEKHSVSKLIGSPPGYVAYEEGGQLTEKVRSHPFSVILFDEVEKAHPDLLDVFLQLLDEGFLTDGKGRQVDFRHSILIFTTNIGTEAIRKQGIGFGQTTYEEDYMHFERRLNAELKRRLKSEFLNRIDEVVVFKSLSEEDVMLIIDRLLIALSHRVETLGYTIEFSKGVKRQILAVGYSDEYGVRSLKRAITRLVENPLSEYMIQHREGGHISVKLNGHKTIVIESSVRKGK